jgi:hypothetical protein
MTCTSLKCKEMIKEKIASFWEIWGSAIIVVGFRYLTFRYKSWRKYNNLAAFGFLKSSRAHQNQNP